MSVEQSGKQDVPIAASASAAASPSATTSTMDITITYIIRSLELHPTYKGCYRQYKQELDKALKLQNVPYKQLVCYAEALHQIARKQRSSADLRVIAATAASMMEGHVKENIVDLFRVTFNDGFGSWSRITGFLDIGFAAIVMMLITGADLKGALPIVYWLDTVFAVPQLPPNNLTIYDWVKATGGWDQVLAEATRQRELDIPSFDYDDETNLKNYNPFQSMESVKVKVFRKLSAAKEPASSKAMKRRTLTSFYKGPSVSKAKISSMPSDKDPRSLPYSLSSRPDSRSSRPDSSGSRPDSRSSRTESPSSQRGSSIPPPPAPKRTAAEKAFPTKEARLDPSMNAPRPQVFQQDPGAIAAPGVPYAYPGQMPYANPGLIPYGNPGQMPYANPGPMSYANPGKMQYYANQPQAQYGYPGAAQYPPAPAYGGPYGSQYAVQYGGQVGNQYGAPYGNQYAQQQYYPPGASMMPPAAGMMPPGVSNVPSGASNVPPAASNVAPGVGMASAGFGMPLAGAGMVPAGAGMVPAGAGMVSAGAGMVPAGAGMVRAGAGMVPLEVGIIPKSGKMP